MNDSDQAGRLRALPRTGVLVALVVLLLGAAAGGWGYLNQAKFSSGKRVQPGVALIAPMATPVTLAAPVAPPPVQPSGVGPVTMTPALPGAVDSGNAALKADRVARAPVLESGAALTFGSLKMDNSFRSAPKPDAASRATAPGPAPVVPERPTSAPPTTSAAGAPVAALAVPQSLPRQSPALEALAQAQSQWNSGAREMAMDLLREALAAAERASPAGSTSGRNSALTALARELARMELAEGRVSQALEMLTRLEPALSASADVWAIRGNAAQRLGRHQESAAAYLAALKLRPEEPRWMLGAAVSLAAQGQTGPAAELAEKARAGGVLSAEVATYLRQLGVQLRER